MKSKKNHKYYFLIIFRHSLVSLVCASMEFSIFMLMFSWLKLNLLPSFVISLMAATLIGFIGHSIFTFKLGRLYKRNALFFFFQASCALVLGYSIVFILVNAGLHPAIAKASQLGIIFFFNLSFGKLLSFRKL